MQRDGAMRARLNVLRQAVRIVCLEIRELNEVVPDQRNANYQAHLADANVRYQEAIEEMVAEMELQQLGNQIPAEFMFNVDPVGYGAVWEDEDAPIVAVDAPNNLIVDNFNEEYEDAAEMLRAYENAETLAAYRALNPGHVNILFQRRINAQNANLRDVACTMDEVLQEYAIVPEIGNVDPDHPNRLYSQADLDRFSLWRLRQFNLPIFELVTVLAVYEVDAPEDLDYLKCLERDVELAPVLSTIGLYMPNISRKALLGKRWITYIYVHININNHARRMPFASTLSNCSLEQLQRIRETLIIVFAHLIRMVHSAMYYAPGLFNANGCAGENIWFRKMIRAGALNHRIANERARDKVLRLRQWVIDHIGERLMHALVPYSNCVHTLNPQQRARIVAVGGGEPVIVAPNNPLNLQNNDNV